MILMIILSLSHASAQYLDSADLVVSDPTIGASATYGIQFLASNVSTGTQFTIKIPYQLQVPIQNNTLFPTCILSTSQLIGNQPVITNNLSVNCLYLKIYPNQYLTYTTSGDLSNFQIFTIFFGALVNPPVCASINSFGITVQSGAVVRSKQEKLRVDYSAGNILGLSLIVGSSPLIYSASLDQYTFSFRITHNIPAGGSIKLTFPSASWGVNPLSPTTSLSFNFGTTSLKLTGFSPSQTPSSYIFQAFLSNALPATSQILNLTLYNIYNPNRQGLSQSITIQTLDKANNLIDQSSDPLQVNVLTTSPLTLLSFKQLNPIVDGVDLLQLSISSNQSAFNSGGYIEVIGPSPYLSTSSPPVCLSSYGFLTQAATCDLSRNQQTVLIYSDLDSEVTQQNFAITYQNPLGVLNVPSLQVNYRNKDNTLSGSVTSGITYQTVSGAIQILAMERLGSMLIVGNFGTTIQIKFKCDHRVRSNGVITILIPIEQMQYNPYMTCSLVGLPSNQLTCTVTSNDTYTSITMNQWVSATSADVPPQSVFALQLNNATNPPFIADAQNLPSISITTYNLFNSDPNLYIVDQITTGVYLSKQIYPGAIQNFLVTLPSYGSTFSLTNGVNSYLFTFTSVTQILQNGYISITFPPNTAYMNTSVLICYNTPGPRSAICSAQAIPTEPSKVQSVKFSSVCSGVGGCPAGTVFSLTINGLLNPFSTQPPPQLTFSLFTMTQKGQLIDSGYTNTVLGSLLPNSLNANIVMPSGTIFTGQEDTYVISVQNPNNIIPASKGSLIITFPPEVPIQVGAMCTANTPSILLSCSIISQTLNITSPLVDLPQYTNITVSLAQGAINPTSTKTSSLFQVGTYYYGIYPIDSMAGLNITANTPNLVNNVQITRSSSVAGQAVTLSLCFSTTNSIPVNAQITVTIPVDQAIYTLSSLIVTDSFGFTLPITSQVAMPSTNSFTLNEWCSKLGSCAPSNKQCLTISGFQNPSNYSIPTSSLSIQVRTSQNYLVDALNYGIAITPFINLGTLTINSFLRINDVVGQQPTFNFRITTDPQSGALSDYNSPQIVVQFPPSFVINKATSPPTCQLSSDGVNWSVASCSQLVGYDDSGLGSYIQILSINVKCAGTINCGAGQSMSVKIFGTGLANLDYQKIFSGSTISIATAYTSGYQQVKSSAHFVLGPQASSSVYVRELISESLSVQSITRSSSKMNSNVTLSLQVTSPARILKNSFINILIPLAQFELTGDAIYYSAFQFQAQNSPAIFVGSDANFIALSLLEQCSGSQAFCASNQVLTFSITSGLRNSRFDGASQNNFLVSVVTPNRYIDVESNQEVNAATPSLTQNSILIQKVQLSSNRVGASGVNLSLQLNFGVNLFQNDTLVITLSNQFVKPNVDSNSPICSTSIANSNIQTTLNCTSNTSASGYFNSFKMKLCQSSSGCSLTNSYTLVIANLVNILEQVPFTGTMKVQVLSSSNNVISESSYDLSTYPMLQAGLLQQATVTRSVSIQGSVSDVTIQFYLPVPTRLIASTQVYIYLPINQIELKPGATSFSVKTGSQTFTSSVTTKNSTYQVLSFKYWNCVTQDCWATLDQTTLIISSAQNPNVEQTVQDSFLIQFLSPNGNLVFQTQMPLVPRKMVYGEVSNIQVVNANTSYTNDKTSYIISFDTNVDVPVKGLFNIMFPENRVGYNPKLKPICTYQNKNQKVSSSWSSTTVTNQILTLQFSQLCQKSICAASRYIITCTGLTNPSSVRLPTQNLTISATDSSGNIVVIGSILGSSLSTILPTPVTPTFTTQRQFFPKGRTFNISFYTSNPLPADGSIRVIIPLLTPQMMYQDPVCKNGQTLDTVVCNTVFSNSTQVWIEAKNSFCSGGDCLSKTKITLVFGYINYPELFYKTSWTKEWQVLTVNGNNELLDGTVAGLIPTEQTCI